MNRKKSETVQLKLRFPESLRLRIDSAAKQNQRSMNAEIIKRLEQSFQRQDQAALVERTATAVMDKFMKLVHFPPKEGSSAENAG